MENIRELIDSGRAVLGIELGSTRIKAVLIDDNHKPIASGGHSWENRYEEGIWCYHLEDVHEGLRDCFQDLQNDVQKKYGTQIKNLAAMGISAMMHGYMTFNKENEMIHRFRTWRNTNAAEAAAELTELFDFNMPDRWSGAQLYQSILEDMDHVKDINYMTTLSGYVHWKLTGEKVLSVGDASGMFPIDTTTNDFNSEMLDKFDAHVAHKGYPWKVKEILPKVLVAGQNAGYLTEEGAAFLDPTGNLQAGVPFCAPEGDVGTGMVATNSVAPGTGNFSAGTSGFLMVVFEKPLSKMYRVIDICQTPDGYPVGQIHSNTCTSDLNAWVNLFGEFAALTGNKMSPDELFGTLYNEALKGDPDCGGLTSYGYYSGEFITDVPGGRPLFVRKPSDNLSLANFMRSHLYASVAVVRIGTDIMTKEENVPIRRMTGHGGLFKTPVVGQKIMAASLGIPVSCMETAGEGGAWGIALLAAYLINNGGQSLSDYLDEKVFADCQVTTIDPDPEDVKGYEVFIERYKAAMDTERMAVKNLP